MTARAAVILAAGQGTRMKSPTPKVLHPVAGRTMLGRLGDPDRDFAGPRFPLALALMLAGAIAEGFGILMIVPLVAFAVDGAQLPSQLQFLADITRLVPPESRFLLAIALFLIAMILRSILLYARDMLLVRLQSEHEASMQVRAAATLAARGWSFAAKIGQAGMQALLINDLGRAALAVTLAQQAVVAFAMLAVQGALAFFLSPTMTSKSRFRPGRKLLRPMRLSLERLL